MGYPTTSIVLACLSRFEDLAPANFPAGVRPQVYLDAAPQAKNGEQVYPPYCVVRDQGQVPTHIEFERTTLEVVTLFLELYYPTLAECDVAAAATKLNGGSRAAALGFDYGELPALELPRESYQILRTRETRNLAGYGRDGKRVHKVTLEYRVTVKESS